MSIMDNKDFDYYDKEYDRLESIRSASEDLREERTFDIASGGLALSIGIFAYLSANEKELPCEWIIVAVMVCFGLAIVINYISHYKSVRVMEKNVEVINTMKRDNQKYDADAIDATYRKNSKLLKVMNCLVFALTLTGVCLVVIYGIAFVI